MARGAGGTSIGRITLVVRLQVQFGCFCTVAFLWGLVFCGQRAYHRSVVPTCIVRGWYHLLCFFCGLIYYFLLNSCGLKAVSIILTCSCCRLGRRFLASSFLSSFFAISRC